MASLMASRTGTMLSTRSASVMAPLRPSRPVPMRAMRVSALLKTKEAVRKISQNGTPGGPEAPKKKPGVQLGFTKENELFVGRAAMLGFAFSLIGEVLTGRGALSQLGYEIFDDKLGTYQLDALVIGLIAFNLFFAILPSSGTFKRDDEVQGWKGPTQNPKANLTEDPKKFLGLGPVTFGFTKENERFVGRVAQLGFAASLIGESLTGKGALAQFGFETGVGLRETEFGLLAFIAFFFLAALNPGTGKYVDADSDEYDPTDKIIR